MAGRLKNTQSTRESYMDAVHRVFDEFEQQERDRRAQDRAEREPYFARLLDMHGSAGVQPAIEPGE